jgi:hypothetical protein
MQLQERLRADALSLQTLASLNPDHLVVSHRAPDLRRFMIDVTVDAPVAAESGYRVEPRHRLVVEIPDGYLSRDANGLFIKSRIKRDGARLYHPNCFPSDGYLCFDDQFHPAKSLADQVATVVEMMQCRAVNHDSPADWDADYYFLKNAEAVRSQIRPVRIFMPRRGLRMSVRSTPRLL